MIWEQTQELEKLKSQSYTDSENITRIESECSILWEEIRSMSEELVFRDDHIKKVESKYKDVKREKR